MGKWIVIMLTCLLFSGTVRAAGEYGLRPGDVLSVNVFGYPEVSLAEIVIRPDGYIAIPMVGELAATNQSPSDFAKQVADKLGKYYVSPLVTVNVIRFSTARVYVLGEVNRPGVYELDKSRTMLDAIGSALGWTKDAAKTKVFLIRKGQQSEPMRINLQDLLKKGDLSQNHSLQEGDIIFLSNNHRIDITRDILPLIDTAYTLKNFNTR